MVIRPVGRDPFGVGQRVDQRQGTRGYIVNDKRISDDHASWGLSRRVALDLPRPLLIERDRYSLFLRVALVDQLTDFLADGLFDWISRSFLRRNLALPIENAAASHLSKSFTRRQLGRTRGFRCHWVFLVSGKPFVSRQAFIAPVAISQAKLDHRLHELVARVSDFICNRVERRHCFGLEPDANLSRARPIRCLFFSVTRVLAGPGVLFRHGLRYRSVCRLGPSVSASFDRLDRRNRRLPRLRPILQCWLLTPGGSTRSPSQLAQFSAH